MVNANRFEVGDEVVVLDRTATHMALDAEGRPLRGKVVRTSWSECHVELRRTGDVIPAPQGRLRRCPQLAYCRPRALPSGAA